MDLHDARKPKSIRKELNKEIRLRSRWEVIDFYLAHTFLWISILASFTSAIFLASDKYMFCSKLITAAVAGIPGLVVIIDKTFDFAKRASWGSMYKIELLQLKDDLDFEIINVHKAARKFRLLMKKHTIYFQRIGFFSKGKDSDTAEIH
nr:hypothetical protein [uncultured Dyadobacter sp.]